MLFDPETHVALPSFIDIASAVFDSLDKDGKGYLAPETFGSLLDILDYPEAGNIWRIAMRKAEGPQKEHIADRTLKRFYDNDSIRYILGFRAGSSQSTSPQSPLLTRKGFVDLWGMDVLDDTVTLRSRINMGLRIFQPTVWKQRGDVPEWVFPKEPVHYEVYSKTRLTSTQSSLKTFTETPQILAPFLVEPVLAGHTWSQPIVSSSQRQAKLQPPTVAPTEPTYYAPSDNDEGNPEALRRAEQELEELEKFYNRQLEELKRANDLEYTKPQQQMNLDALRSMERSRNFMGTIGQDRDYIIERHYYN